MKNKETFKHNQSVRVEESNGWVNEYDQWDRNTFHMMPSGYWCLNFFEPVVEGKPVNVQPYQSVHKYWPQYNNLTF